METLEAVQKRATKFAALAKKHGEGDKKDPAKARHWRKLMKRAQRQALPLKKAAKAKAEAAKAKEAEAAKKAEAAAAAAPAAPAEAKS